MPMTGGRRSVIIVLAILGALVGSGVANRAEAWKSGPGYECASTTSCQPGDWNCEVICTEGHGCQCTIHS